MRAPVSKRVRRPASAAITARLSGRAAIDLYANGEIVARFDDFSVGLGVLGADASAWLQKLHIGVPLGSVVSGGRKINKEIDLVVKRLAELRLLEFRIADPHKSGDLVVIEPQVRGYWPQSPSLQNADTLILSRFAYMRRRGTDMVLESPRASALFRLLDPALVSFIAALSSPRRVDALRKEDGFPGLPILALLLDCQIIDRTGAAKAGTSKKDHNLALWEFHDLLFHARGTSGRHTNPIGSVYPHIGTIPALPAVRRAWPGKKTDLRAFATADAEDTSPLARLLRERRSTRRFDDARPITLGELSRFLEKTARILSTSDSKPELDDGGVARRPYPSAGASYELEIYLAVHLCEGLPRGFYHYDAGAGALVLIDASSDDLKIMLSEALYAMGTEAMPQVLITIAARFGRISWKYSSIAYSLILKDVGVLTQTFYLAATDMGLGGCAIGIVNIDLFARMTGTRFDIEGTVGQFAIGRPKASGPSQ